MGNRATIERPTGGLVRYVVVATLARGADAGAAVGVVLLATMPSAAVARPGLVGGLLAACLTAPHLLGPVVARRLDRARDGRLLIAGATVLFGLCLAGAALVIGHVHVLLVGALVTAAGTCGPLLTGGLSSRLAGLVGAGERAQRRSQGWDGVTYGIAWTAGPAATAALAAVGTARLSVVVLEARSCWPAR